MEWQIRANPLHWRDMPAFPSSAERRPPIPSVSDLTRQIRESLEGRYADVWVEGEISNYRPHSSGHHYFTLKDARAQISCVMWRNQSRSLPEPIRDGRLVQAQGAISVYEARGQYQLVVNWMQPKGFGELQARFEALKRRLDAEGLFSPERKRRLPSFPRSVALVTSSTGAAIQDMLNILSRRAPWLSILVWPVRVQGDGAAAEIAAAVGQIGHPGAPPVDVVIVGRGGGSIEDLWSFNEESVARAIAACPVPVISAVGHEIDFTIADFVADLRAPTPSAAAELVAPDGVELRHRLENHLKRLDLRLERVMTDATGSLDYQRRSLAAREPSRRIGECAQMADDLRDQLEEAIDDFLSNAWNDLDQSRRILDLKHPGAVMARFSERLREWPDRLNRRLDGLIETRSTSLFQIRKMLELLSPDSVFRRGYSMTLDENGNILTDSARISSGDRLRTRLAKGEVLSVAE
jgi:exodeoxyribonuclease VII large subunit